MDNTEMSVFMQSGDDLVPSYTFVPEGLTGHDAEPRVTLLYRPGHYDLLYAM